MINPILAFSGRRRMRSMRTALLLTLYGAAVLLFGLGVSFAQLCGKTVSIYGMRSGLEGYACMLAFQFVLILLVTPALTAGSISGERERQTLELLLVTNTGSFRIVTGKLMESLGLMALLIVATLPAMCLPLLLGCVTLGQVLEGLLFLGVTAFAALSVGMLASTLFRRTVASTVVAYLAVFGIGILTLLPIVRDVARMSAAYDMMFSSTVVIGSADGPTQVYAANGVMLWSFVFNPALGLCALIADQTGMLRGTVSNISYTLYSMYDYIDFAALKWYSMGFMLLAGMALNLLSVCFVRPRNKRARKMRKTE